MNNTAVMFRRNVRLVYIVLAAAVFSALQPYFHLITESRTYRELTLQMPFSNVMDRGVQGFPRHPGAVRDVRSTIRTCSN